MNMPPREFLNMLNGNIKAKYSIKALGDGKFYISNGCILKCVEEYYIPPEGNSSLPKFSNNIPISTKCQAIRRAYLGERNYTVGNMMCERCHVACFNENLERKKIKKKEKISKVVIKV